MRHRIDAGEDLNIKNNNGYTQLHLATEAVHEGERKAYITGEVGKLVNMYQQKYQISIA